jgi:hypothetical protein
MEGVPTEFAIPSNQVLETKYFAVGIQNYRCNGTEYQLESAKAELWGNSELRGTSIGRHYFNVTEEAVGTTIHFEVNGSVLRSRAIRVVNATNPMHDLPQVLFQKAGSGNEVGTTEYVAQLHTRNGVPVRQECSENQRILIPYTAEYWFFGTQSNFINRNSIETMDTGAYPTLRPQVNSAQSLTLTLALGIFLLVILSKV